MTSAALYQVMCAKGMTIEGFHTLLTVGHYSLLLAGDFNTQLVFLLDSFSDSGFAAGREYIGSVRRCIPHANQHWQYGILPTSKPGVNEMFNLKVFVVWWNGISMSTGKVRSKFEGVGVGCSLCR